MRLPIQVQAIVFRLVNGRFQYLLLKRTSERDGFWQPVTGGIEEGETKTDAVRREVREETGIANFLRMIENVHYFEYSFPHLIKEYVFGVEIQPSAEIVVGEEHSQFKWCNYREAIKILKWEENKDALSRLYEILSKNNH